VDTHRAFGGGKRTARACCDGVVLDAVNRDDGNRCECFAVVAMQAPDRSPQSTITERVSSAATSPHPPGDWRPASRGKVSTPRSEESCRWHPAVDQGTGCITRPIHPGHADPTPESAGRGGEWISRQQPQRPFGRRQPGRHSSHRDHREDHPPGGTHPGAAHPIRHATTAMGLPQQMAPPPGRQANGDSHSSGSQQGKVAVGFELGRFVGHPCGRRRRSRALPRPEGGRLADR